MVLAERVEAEHPPKDSTAMQIFVRDLSGATLTLDCSPAETVGDVCLRAQQKQGYCCDMLRMVHAGKQLDAEASLAECNVGKASQLHMLGCLDGGVIEPSLVVLAKKYNQDKQVCRICYARLPARASNCRKKKCGHTNQLRPKKKLK